MNRQSLTIHLIKKAFSGGEACIRSDLISPIHSRNSLGLDSTLFRGPLHEAQTRGAASKLLSFPKTDAGKGRYDQIFEPWVASADWSE